MLIKFNNIRDLADARYAAAMMAEWIGFKVGGKDSLTAEKIQEIIGWCAGPKLVLEIENGASIEMVKSYLDTLPVDGLEVEFEDFEKLKTTFGELNLFWIVRNTDSGFESEINAIEHSDLIKVAQNTIVKINPEHSNYAQFEQNEPWAISLNCFEADENGMKVFEQWNNFFEAIHMF